MSKIRVAGLDLGSNTFLCLVADVENINGSWVITKIVSDQIEIVRLGQNLEKTKRLHSEALIRAERALKRFKEEIDLHKPEKVLAMATSAARDAENKDELFELLKKYQIPIEIISGQQETAITFSGAVSNLPQDNSQILVVDIGGGSTEFIFGTPFRYLSGVSLDIGCVRLSERFISRHPVTSTELKNIEEHVKSSIANALKLKPEKFSVNNIVAVAGTPTTLAAADVGGFDAEKIDGYKLTKENLENWKKKITNSSLEKIVEMGIPKGRADVILVGVVTLLELLSSLNLESVAVSTRGVRFGIVLELAAHKSI
jgi:exopolyphosphatase/guanosine-5'-triphosphate,3'-diphosphate pyrophosphatase